MTHGNCSIWRADPWSQQHGDLHRAQIRCEVADCTLQPHGGRCDRTGGPGGATPDDAGVEITTPYVTGVMMVRGASAARSYWNRPDKTAHTMRHGWLYTDDLFDRDEDGFYIFTGRANDIFKVSGQWISPPAVEAARLLHPAVFESAVVPF